MSRTFLEAEWRKLAMANYAVDEAVLKPYLPRHTELDTWNNTCYVSLVGFMFLETKVKGFRIPFHVDFEEVNLRFYVRHNDGGVWKRGVVFSRPQIRIPRRRIPDTRQGGWQIVRQQLKFPIPGGYRIERHISAEAATLNASTFPWSAGR